VTLKKNPFGHTLVYIYALHILNPDTWHKFLSSIYIYISSDLK